MAHICNKSLLILPVFSTQSLFINKLMTTRLYLAGGEVNCNELDVRGLGFKFVDFLGKRSDVCHTDIKML